MRSASPILGCVMGSAHGVWGSRDPWVGAVVISVKDAAVRLPLRPAVTHHTSLPGSGASVPASAASGQLECPPPAGRAGMSDHGRMKTWTPADWDRFNDPVVEAFRANAGRVLGRGPTLLLTTVGAQSGLPRMLPLNFSRDGDRYVVIGSKGGSPTHPHWYLNLVANPIVTIEAGTTAGIEVFRARASSAGEPERTRLFDAQVAIMPFFDGYRRAVTDRDIPVVVFERLPEGDPEARAGR